MGTFLFSADSDSVPATRNPECLLKSPGLIAVARVLLRWVEYRRSQNGQVRKFGTEIALSCPLIPVREFSRMHRQCSFQRLTEQTGAVPLSSSEVYGVGVCSRKVL